MGETCFHWLPHRSRSWRRLPHTPVSCHSYISLYEWRCRISTTLRRHITSCSCSRGFHRPSGVLANCRATSCTSCATWSTAPAHHAHSCWCHSAQPPPLPQPAAPSYSLWVIRSPMCQHMVTWSTITGVDARLRSFTNDISGVHSWIYVVVIHGFIIMLGMTHVSLMVKIEHDGIFLKKEKYHFEPHIGCLKWTANPVVLKVGGSTPVRGRGVGNLVRCHASNLMETFRLCVWWVCVSIHTKAVCVCVSFWSVCRFISRWQSISSRAPYAVNGTQMFKSLVGRFVPRHLSFICVCVQWWCNSELLKRKLEPMKRRGEKQREKRGGVEKDTGLSSFWITESCVGSHVAMKQDLGLY